MSECYFCDAEIKYHTTGNLTKEAGVVVSACKPCLIRRSREQLEATAARRVRRWLRVLRLLNRLRP